MCRDVLHVLPGDPDRAASAEPTEEPAEQPGSLSPHSGTAQDCDHLERLARIALECEVVNVPAPASLRVEELAIDEV